MSKVRKWSCNSCCKSFNQRQSLHRHQKNCSNEDSIVKTFTCENCSKVLTRQDSLKRHSKTCKGEKVVTTALLVRNHSKHPGILMATLLKFTLVKKRTEIR